MRLAGLTFKVGSAGKRARLAQSGRGQTRGQTAKSFLWIALTTPQTPQYADASGTLSLFESWIRREPKAVPPTRPSWGLLVFQGSRAHAKDCPLKATRSRCSEAGSVVKVRASLYPRKKLVARNR